MDETINRVVNGISKDARRCLVSILGNAVNIVRNLDVLCPDEEGACLSDGPLCGDLQALHAALLGEDSSSEVPAAEPQVE